MDSDVFWSVAAILGLGVFAYAGLRRMLRRRAARAWPAVTGAVSSSKLEIQDRGDQPMHVASLTYSYLIDGATYSGQHEHTFVLHGRAVKWIARYQEGAAVRIRYDAENVGDSVLLEDEQDSRKLRRQTMQTNHP